jgi:serine/threonine-protein kinase
MILGTAAYMSPEQAKGRTVDRRTDIWAFGVVLYEMLTGKQLFTGEGIGEILASIIKEEPKLDALPARVAPIVERCLRKDLRKRWQAVGDIRIALEEGIPVSAGVPAIRRPTAWMALAGIGLLIAAAAFWIAWRATRAVEHPLMRLSVDLGPDAVAGLSTTAAISPDGTRLAFPARSADGQRQLATRLLDQPQATLLAGTENAEDPFYSPDGQWVGFFAEGKMKKVSVRGGAVVTLCDAPSGRGAAWGEDGNIIATLNSTPGTGLSRVPAAGGLPQVLTKPGEGEVTNRWPQILPGGQSVLFTGSNTTAIYDDASIEVLSLKTGQARVVQRGGYFGRYLPGGYLVYLHQGTLFGVPFDRDRLEVRGTPAPLLEDVAGNKDTGGGQFDSSRNGTFVYLSGKPSGGNLTVAWLDSAGNTEPLLPAPGNYLDLRLSPDGNRLAFSTGAEDIRVYDRGRNTTTRLTFTHLGSRFPVWTPDGKHIVFQSQGASSVSLEWIRADGSGEAQRLLERKTELRSYSFSPDGKRLAFSELNAETGMDIWMLPLDASDPERPKPGKPEPFLRTAANELEPEFSPDGRWIAYMSDETQRFEVYVRPLLAGGSSGSGKWLISTGGGRLPAWSRDGRELFYETLDNRIMALSYTAKGDSFTPDKPRLWSSMQLFDLAPALNLDLAPDGKRFAVVPLPESAGEQKGPLHATFLLNFFDEVRRRIPAGK